MPLQSKKFAIIKKIFYNIFVRIKKGTYSNYLHNVNVVGSTPTSATRQNSSMDRALQLYFVPCLYNPA